MPGPVALVGSGEFLPVMEAVDRALLAGRPPRLVIVPTAAGQEGDARVGFWLDLGVEHAARLGVDAVPVDARTRADADDGTLAARVRGAGLVYLSGGNPGYLATTLRASALWRAIVEEWMAGAALAGCSAGAAALTALVHHVDRPGFPAEPGLALIPHLAVLAHFDRIEQWAPGIVARTRDEMPVAATLVGIDEETALVGGPQDWQVHGRGAVWIIARDGERHRYGPGTAVTLPHPAP